MTRVAKHRKPAPQKRLGSRLVRLPDRVLELLDGIRTKSPRRYNGYGQLIEELALQYRHRGGWLTSGLPHRTELPHSQNGHEIPRGEVRSSIADDVARDGEGSPA